MKLLLQKIYGHLSNHSIISTNDEFIYISYKDHGSLKIKKYDTSLAHRDEEYNPYFGDNFIFRTVLILVMEKVFTKFRSTSKWKYS